MKKVKAITLYQPYASLIMLGIKGYETRGWDTRYRGEMAIHAGKQVMPFDEIFENLTDYQRKYLMDAICKEYGSYENMPTGAILGTVQLTNTYYTENITHFIPYFPERICGDYTPGRFAWKLENINKFIKPIPARGKQGLWDWVV